MPHHAKKPRLLTLSELTVASNSEERFEFLILHTLSLLEGTCLREGEDAQRNDALVKSHEDIESIYRGLLVLKGAGLFNHEHTQHNFISLLTHPQPFSLANIFEILHEGHLLQDDHRQAIVTAVLRNPDIYALREILAFVQSKDLLNAHHLQLILAHHDLVGVEQIFPILDETCLLSGAKAHENLAAVLNHEHPDDLEFALALLQEAHLLSSINAQSNLSLILGYPDPDVVAKAFVILKETNLLENEFIQVNLSSIFEHEYPEEVVKVLAELQKFHLLNDSYQRENFQAVLECNHQHGELFQALEILKRTGLLMNVGVHACLSDILVQEDLLDVVQVMCIFARANLLSDEFSQKNIQAILNHKELHFLRYCLEHLEQLGLLQGVSAQSNAAAILAHQDCNTLSEILEGLHENQILTQASFERLIQSIPVLFSRTVGEALFEVPSYLWTATHFLHIMEICEDETQSLEERQQRVFEYLEHQQLEIEDADEAAPIEPFNGAQSTHTSSVHISTSESAKKLLLRYGKMIEGDKALSCCIETLQSRLSHLDRSLKNNAAKRCLARMTHLSFSFNDPDSNVSVLQLLAINGLAIDDSDTLSHLQATPTDAFQALVEGLYEIQRGNNLDEEGEDDGDPDAPICVSGTFNKLINCLQGIHPDYTIIMKTKQTALAKLSPVILDIAMAYLKSEQEKSSQEAFAQLLMQIKHRHLESIWDNIKEQVYTTIVEEFEHLLTPQEIDISSASIELDVSHLEVTSMASIVYVSQNLHGIFAHSPREDIAQIKEDSMVTSMAKPTL